MAEPLDSIVAAFRARQFVVSLHHWQQVVSDDRPVPSLVEAGIAQDRPEVLRVYEEDNKGKSCLILCEAPNGEPMHVVIGFEQSPMTLVTAYPPDPEIWEDDNRTRRKGPQK